MDRLSSIVAAFEAGKLPSQLQILNFIQFLKHSIILRAENNYSKSLSEVGRQIVDDVRSLLDAYVRFGEDKNQDDLLQEAIWHLTQSSLQEITPENTSPEQAAKDIKAVRSSLKTLLDVIWSSVSPDKSLSPSDLLSFGWTSLTDAFGSNSENDDKTISVAKDESNVKPELKSESLKDKVRTKFLNGFYQVCDKAQSDSTYSNAVVTLINIIQHWLRRMLDNDAVSEAEQGKNDHFGKAAQSVRTLLERLANEKVTSSMVDAAQECLGTVRGDAELQGWFEDLFSFVNRCLIEQGYTRSESFGTDYNHLKSRWSTFLDGSSSWRENINNLKAAFNDLYVALLADDSLVRVRDAQLKLARDITVAFQPPDVSGQTGVQAIWSRASWLWNDMFKVYLPAAFRVLKNNTVPRLEYQDSEIEFVLENLHGSALELHPTVTHIRNVTDIDISTSPSGESTSGLKTSTYFKAQGVRIYLRDVSFWYRDKTAAIGPSDFSGLIKRFAIPPKGIDVEIKIRLLPAIPGTSSSPEREFRGSFHALDGVNVRIASDEQIDFDVEESNHPILLSMFKPLFVSRLRMALEKTLTEQITILIESLDSIAWNVHRTSQSLIERDGMSRGGAFAFALWSEIGRMREIGEGSGGVTVTATGVIFEAKDPGSEATTRFAVGADPQILSPDKKGPKGDEPATSVFERLGSSLSGWGLWESDEDIMGRIEKSVEDDKIIRPLGVLEHGRETLATFRKTVDAKVEAEHKAEGWQSQAFLVGI